MLQFNFTVKFRFPISNFISWSKTGGFSSAIYCPLFHNAKPASVKNDGHFPKNKFKLNNQPRINIRKFLLITIKININVSQEKPKSYKSILNITPSSRQERKRKNEQKKDIKKNFMMFGGLFCHHYSWNIKQIVQLAPQIYFHSKIDLILVFSAI